MQIPPPRTPEEARDLIDRLDEIVSKSDKTQMTHIYDYQDNHRNYMINHYNRFIGQFETFFCSMTDHSTNINYLYRNWPPSRGLQFIITTAALKQLHSSFILLNYGAYEDSITVLRSVYESFLRVVFISMYPDSAGNVYDRHPKSGVKFNATNLISTDLKLGWTKYNIMSVFAHSNSYRVMETAIEIGFNKNPIPVQLDYEKDDDMIGLIINLINFLMTAYLTMYDELFTVDMNKYSNKNKAVIQSHLDNLHQHAVISQEALRTHNESEYFRKSAIDLENIISMMIEVDNDPSKDWKSVWNSIRLL